MEEGGAISRKECKDAGMRILGWLWNEREGMVVRKGLLRVNEIEKGSKWN